MPELGKREYLTMENLSVRNAIMIATALLLPLAQCSGASGQVVDNPGFKAMPRPINYAAPLAPKGGVQAVIVYGKDAPWTKMAAEALQKAVADWSGVKHNLVDDRTVISDETWLLKESWRKTPLIVLGNAQDNRVIHALGTRWLAQSSRSWPGGDRFVIRSLFEPFAADVNCIVLEASNQAGMDAAVAKFSELLKTFPKDPPAIPRLRVVSAGKDKWDVEQWNWWKTPPEMTSSLNRSASELAMAYKGPTITAGDNFAKAGLGGEIFYNMMGGIAERPSNVRPTTNLDDGRIRAMAAMWLLGYRAVGGRSHSPSDHYGGMNSLIGLRSLLQSGVLTEKEVNEFESCLVLSAAYPDEYPYEWIAADKFISGRHGLSCLYISLFTQDYVLNHCRMDEKTRKEVQRRYEGTRKTTTQYLRSFRDSGDDSCLGEDTLLQVYALLHEGMLDFIRNGNLKRSADSYVLTSDNLYMPGQWPYYGCYAGLSGFSSGPGGITGCMFGGRGLFDAAAFYYDDPDFQAVGGAEASQYRWLAQNWGSAKGSVALGFLGMHWDTGGKQDKPTMYTGVRALPFDRRLYELLKEPEGKLAAQVNLRLPPDPQEKAVDRVAFRDGMDPKDAYLFLATSQDISREYPAQNNSIARYTDLEEIWLYANMTSYSTWSRSVVSISNGKSFIPRGACLLEAIGDIGEFSVAASREQGVGGTDWTRAIVHWRGHYFTVLDRMEALQEDDYVFVNRWRTLHPASLENGVWTVSAPTGAAMKIQSADTVFQTSERWAIDGSAAPFVLEQYKQARLFKGESRTYQNLMYVSAASRQDSFETRQASPAAMLVNGKTAAGAHLALIGIGPGTPTPEFQTDAAIYVFNGPRLHLAAVRKLSVNTATGCKDLFWADRPVNLLVDCATGKAQLDIPSGEPVEVKAGSAWSRRLPGRSEAVLAEAGAMSDPAKTIEGLWARAAAPGAAGQRQPGPSPFEVLRAGDSFQRPLRRYYNFTVSSTPEPSNQAGSRRSWDNSDNLAITLTFPQPTDVSCLRLVTITKMVPLYGLGSELYGHPHYPPGDFEFDVVLSNDGFQKDLRKIEFVKADWEETAEVSVGHFSMLRLPTWRVHVNGKARQVRLLPRAKTKERSAFYLSNLEIYGPDRVDELVVQAFAADIDGDGSNELVAGTSEKELAAFSVDGKRLWKNVYGLGDIHTVAVADLDEDGKFETLAYLTTDELRRVNGDGSEWPVADLSKVLGTRKGAGSVVTVGAWAPNGLKQKEVVMWSEPMYRVLPDGKVVMESGKIGHPQGVGRLINLYPNEPEVLVTFARYSVQLWSPRRSETGGFASLGYRPVAGGDSGENHGMGWMQQVDAAGLKGFLTAMEGGLNWYPVTTFLPGAKEEGWGFNTGGVPATAAVAGDINGDGVPEVFLGKKDGFVNVFSLSDGKLIGLLNTGEPIVGVVLLKGADAKPRIAVATKFGVHLFDANLKRIGVSTMSVTAFVGPGGKNKDRVFVVGPDGSVTILTLK